MKILKEIFCEDNPEKRNPLEVKVSSLYSALMENDKGEIETLDFIKKEYPLAGISEYYLLKLNHSNSGKDFAPVEGFFFYGNINEARKYFSGQIPDKILNQEFGNEHSVPSQDDEYEWTIESELNNSREFNDIPKESLI